MKKGIKNKALVFSWFDDLSSAVSLSTGLWQLSIPQVRELRIFVDFINFRLILDVFHTKLNIILTLFLSLQRKLKEIG